MFSIECSQLNVLNSPNDHKLTYDQIYSKIVESAGMIPPTYLRPGDIVEIGIIGIIGIEGLGIQQQVVLPAFENK
jgi:hypothetical protein